MTEIDDIFSRLSKADRTAIGEHLDRINQKLEARAKMADSLMAILEPHILKLIRSEITNDYDK